MEDVLINNDIDMTFKPGTVNRQPIFFFKEDIPTPEPGPDSARWPEPWAWAVLKESNA